MLLSLLALSCAHAPAALPQHWELLGYPSDEAEALLVELWREHRAAARGWQSPPPTYSDLLVEQWWCSAAVPEDDCWTGGVARAELPGAAWRGLAAVVDERGELDRIVVDSGRVAVGEDWGMALTLRLDAEDQSVAFWELAAVRFSGGTVTSRILLSPSLHHSIEQSSFSVDGPSLESLLESPSSFGGQAGGAVAALLAQARAAIEAHQVQKCSYGRYWGDGSPRCDQVALSAREERGAYEQLRIDLGHQENLLRSDAEQLHGLLVELFPQALADRL